MNSIHRLIGSKIIWLMPAVLLLIVFGLIRLSRVNHQDRQPIESTAKSPLADAGAKSTDAAQNRAISGPPSLPAITVAAAPERKHLTPVKLPEHLALMARDFHESPDEVFLKLPEFHGDTLSLILGKLIEFDGGDTEKGIVRGAVADYDGSFFSLSWVGDAVAGSVHLPSVGRVFELAETPDQGLVWYEVDVHQTGHCAVCAEALSNPSVHPADNSDYQSP